MFAFSIGEPIVVPENIQVVVDCGQIIDGAATEGRFSKITWYKDGRTISNGSDVNVVVAVDSRTIIITKTSLRTAAHTSIEGIYSCEVCTGDKTCEEKTSEVEICGK